MAEDTAKQESDRTAEMPFVAPCRRLHARAPLAWIRQGWRDFRHAPRQSLGYGIVITALSWLVTGIGLTYGSYWAALILLSGFVFVAPVLALGLYSISRQLERGQPPSLSRCLSDLSHSIGTAMVIALALLVVFLVWARAGSMIHVFFPMEGHPDWRQLLPFLAIGSAVGSIFAALTFLFTAFSLPMICDRDVDAVTSMVSSVNAVLRNKPAIALWILLIVGLTALGFVTGLLGLAITVPVLGHATWHGYKEIIDASAWPAQKDG